MHLGSCVKCNIETHQQQQTKTFKRILVEPNILKEGWQTGTSQPTTVFDRCSMQESFIIFSLLYFSILSNVLVAYTAVNVAHRMNAHESVSHSVSQAILQSFNPKKNTTVHHH